MTTLIRRTGAIRTVAFGLLLAFVANMALAVQPDEVLDNPALEARARDISKGLRCLVCQNESIDDSNASLARDLRLLVRERLVEGDSNEEVVEFIVDRYGEFVLLKPTTGGWNWLLWAAGPILFVFALIVGGFPAARRAWTGAAIGALYGLAMGFGFASGPLPRTLGIGGVFSTVTVAEFQTTIYLAHLVFGVLLGLLVHAFGSRIPPLWTPALDVVKSIAGSRHTVAGVRSNHE